MGISPSSGISGSGVSDGIGSAGISASFNPLTDLDTLAFYHELRTADAAYETLPSNTLATDQNDGIGAVLDLKRYKERGAEAFSDFGVYGSGWSKSGTSWIHAATAGDDAFVTATAVNDLVVGNVYEIQFTVVAYSAEAGGGGGVGVDSGTSGTAKLYSAAGTHTFLFKAASTDLIFTIRNSASTEVTGITVREIPGYHASQSTAAAQPVLNIEANIRSGLFDGVDDRLVIPNSTGAVNYLHDGSGGEAWVCLRPILSGTGEQYPLGNGSASNNGVHLAYSNTGVVAARLCNGSGSYIGSATSSAGTAIEGEHTVVRATFNASNVRIYKYASSASGVIAESSVTGVPASAAATYDFTIGNWNPGAGDLHADMYSLGIIQGSLTDDQAQRLASYMLRRAGA